MGWACSPVLIPWRSLCCSLLFLLLRFPPGNGLAGRLDDAGVRCAYGTAGSNCCIPYIGMGMYYEECIDSC